MSNMNKRERQWEINFSVTSMVDNWGLLLNVQTIYLWLVYLLTSLLLIRVKLPFCTCVPSRPIHSLISILPSKPMWVYRFRPTNPIIPSTRQEEYWLSILRSLFEFNEGRTTCRWVRLHDQVWIMLRRRQTVVKEDRHMDSVIIDSCI